MYQSACGADEHVLSSEGTKQSWSCRCLAYGSSETGKGNACDEMVWWMRF